MDKEFLRVMESRKYLDDQFALSQVQQLAFGKAVSTIVSTPIVPTAATNLYATSKAGVTSSKQYYKVEYYKVDDAALFMDNKLKISAVNPYTICTDDSMHKIDDMSHISSSYAITEHFNVMHNDNLLTPGSKHRYIINDTKNVVKHLKFFRQTFENIVQHKSSFPIGRIAIKWENLHKALIWLI